MALDLNALKSLRKNSTQTLSKLAEKIKQDDTKSNQDDDRFWKAQIDKAGNGSAVIRFLPAIGENDQGWVKLYNHGFKTNTGKWYIENCRTTLGEPDPCHEHCSDLWTAGQAGDSEAKDLFQQRKRKLSYISNVLIINDPAHPENNGTVKLFKYGKQVFEKIKDKLIPEFKDMEPVDVFNPWEGANFRLRINKKDGWSTTEKSSFDNPSVITEDDSELLKILNSRHDLNELVHPSKFKTYEELQKRLNSVLTKPNGAAARKAAETMLDEDHEESQPKAQRSKPAPVTKSVTPEDEDDMDYFKKLAEDAEDDIPY